SPTTSYFPHLMQEIVCNRASSVGIPTALDAEKVREINDLLLDNMGRYKDDETFNKPSSCFDYGLHAHSGGNLR
ncbi:MAG: hypothetical protein IJF87_01020, partial [Erysipelotrichaceae bacterium]|nr:hypothetical protein [Erysipelotrichaceae bacterium]